MSPAAAPPRTFKTAAAFRAWLKSNHRGATELLVRVFRVHATDQGVGYAEALDEALCFGWIDGVRRRLDADSYLIRFTPRKPRSIWSKVNVAHVERLQAAGRMAPAGLATFAARDQARTGLYSFEQKENPPELSAEFVKRLRANRAAWKHFESEPPWYKRLAAHWVMTAKQETTRHRRLEVLIASAAEGIRIPSQRES